MAMNPNRAVSLGRMPPDRVSRLERTHRETVMSNPSQAVLMRVRRVSSPELQGAVRRAAWRWLVERIARLARALAAERTARRTIRALEAKNDRELRDLGISRSDIPRVVRQTGRSACPEPRLFDDTPWWQWPPR
jgi:uncharacterized protein YjiS (DUF1127 family)